MANKQIDMRKTKQIFKLYCSGTSRRGISLQLGLSRNTVTKYIEFFKRYHFTPYEVEEMTLEELHKIGITKKKSNRGQDFNSTQTISF